MKLIMEVFLNHWSKTYIHVMLEMRELVRYYLLTILNEKSFIFNMTRLKEQRRDCYRNISEEEKEGKQKNIQEIDVGTCPMRKNKNENNI